MSCQLKRKKNKNKKAKLPIKNDKNHSNIRMRKCYLDFAGTDQIINSL